MENRTSCSIAAGVVFVLFVAWFVQSNLRDRHLREQADREEVEARLDERDAVARGAEGRLPLPALAAFRRQVRAAIQEFQAAHDPDDGGLIPMTNRLRADIDRVAETALAKAQRDYAPDEDRAAQWREYLREEQDRIWEEAGLPAKE